MKILVCISKSPDTTSKIAFTDGNSKFDENGVQYVVNTYILNKLKICKCVFHCFVFVNQKKKKSKKKFRFRIF